MSEGADVVFDIDFIWQHSEEPLYLMEDSD
jgi:hypothetical protein